MDLKKKLDRKKKERKKEWIYFVLCLISSGKSIHNWEAQ